MKLKRNKLLASIAVLVGTTVGAGIFGLPYVASQSSIYLMAFYLLVLGGLVLLLQLLCGEVVLRTPGRHRLPGYARIYFGEKVSRLIFFSELLGGFGALLAYLVLGGYFLVDIFETVGLQYNLAVFLFWAVLSLGVLTGLKKVSLVELVESLLLIGVLGAIIFFSLPAFSLKNLLGINLGKLFLPYGAVLFTISGAIAIPEIKDILGQNSLLFKKAIFWGSIIPVLFSLIFAVVVLGVSGSQTTPDALAGLKIFLGAKIILPLALFGLLSLSSSYLLFSVYLKEIFQYDLKIKKNGANFLTLSLPILAFGLGLKNFIGIISFLGAITGGIGFLTTLFLWRQSRKVGLLVPAYQIRLAQPAFWLILAVFVMGAIFQIASYF